LSAVISAALASPRGFNAARAGTLATTRIAMTARIFARRVACHMMQINGDQDSVMTGDIYLGLDSGPVSMRATNGERFDENPAPLIGDN
jgi:hypothetical protein